MSISVIEITRGSTGAGKSRLTIVIISNTIINEYVNNKIRINSVLDTHNCKPTCAHSCKSQLELKF